MTDSEPSTTPTSLSRTRYLAGSLAWVLTLQFFVLEAVTAARFGGYSRVDQAISDLGTAASPAAGLMNASFIAQAVLVVAGAVLLYPALVGLGGRLALALLTAAGAGTLLVGLFPSDDGGATHTVGAILYLLGSGLGLIALAYGVRPRSEPVGTVLALLGLVGVIGTIFFGTGVTAVLGYGGMERMAAYVLPVGLTVAAVLLVRQQDDWRVELPELPEGSGPDDVRLTKRQRRELERAEAFDRARARDEALEAHAKKQRTDDSTDEDDDEPFDEEAAWKTPRQR